MSSIPLHVLQESEPEDYGYSVSQSPQSRDGGIFSYDSNSTRATLKMFLIKSIGLSIYRMQAECSDIMTVQSLAAILNALFDADPEVRKAALWCWSLLRDMYPIKITPKQLSVLIPWFADSISLAFPGSEGACPVDRQHISLNNCQDESYSANYRVRLTPKHMTAVSCVLLDLLTQVAQQNPQHAISREDLFLAGNSKIDDVSNELAACYNNEQYIKIVNILADLLERLVEHTTKASAISLNPELFPFPLYILFWKALTSCAANVSKAEDDAVRGHVASSAVSSLNGETSSVLGFPVLKPPRGPMNIAAFTTLGEDHCNEDDDCENHDCETVWTIRTLTHQFKVCRAANVNQFIIPVLNMTAARLAHSPPRTLDLRALAIIIPLAVPKEDPSEHAPTRTALEILLTTFCSWIPHSQEIETFVVLNCLLQSLRRRLSPQLLSRVLHAMFDNATVRENGYRSTRALLVSIISEMGEVTDELDPSPRKGISASCRHVYMSVVLTDCLLGLDPEKVKADGAKDNRFNVILRHGHTLLQEKITFCLDCMSSGLSSAAPDSNSRQICMLDFLHSRMEDVVDACYVLLGHPNTLFRSYALDIAGMLTRSLRIVQASAREEKMADANTNISDLTRLFSLCFDFFACATKQSYDANDCATTAAALVQIHSLCNEMAACSCARQPLLRDTITECITQAWASIHVLHTSAWMQLRTLALWILTDLAKILMEIYDDGDPCTRIRVITVDMLISLVQLIKSKCFEDRIAGLRVLWPLMRPCIEEEGRPKMTLASCLKISEVLALGEYTSTRVINEWKEIEHTLLKLSHASEWNPTVRKMASFLLKSHHDDRDRKIILTYFDPGEQPSGLWQTTYEDPINLAERIKSSQRIISQRLRELEPNQDLAMFISLSYGKDRLITPEHANAPSLSLSAKEQTPGHSWERDVSRGHEGDSYRGSDEEGRKSDLGYASCVGPSDSGSWSTNDQEDLSQDYLLSPKRALMKVLTFATMNHPEGDHALDDSDEDAHPIEDVQIAADDDDFGNFDTYRSQRFDDEEQRKIEEEWMNLPTSPSALAEEYEDFEEYYGSSPDEEEKQNEQMDSQCGWCCEALGSVYCHDCKMILCEANGCDADVHRTNDHTRTKLERNITQELCSNDDDTRCGDCGGRVILNRCEDCDTKLEVKMSDTKAAKGLSQKIHLKQNIPPHCIKNAPVAALFDHPRDDLGLSKNLDIERVREDGDTESGILFHSINTQSQWKQVGGEEVNNGEIIDRPDDVWVLTTPEEEVNTHPNRTRARVTAAAGGINWSTDESNVSIKSEAIRQQHQSIRESTASPSNTMDNLMDGGSELKRVSQSRNTSSSSSKKSLSQSAPIVLIDEFTDLNLDDRVPNQQYTLETANKDFGDRSSGVQESNSVNKHGYGYGVHTCTSNLKSGNQLYDHQSFAPASIGILERQISKIDARGRWRQATQDLNSQVHIRGDENVYLSDNLSSSYTFILQNQTSTLCLVQVSWSQSSGYPMYTAEEEILNAPSRGVNISTTYHLRPTTKFHVAKARSSWPHLNARLRSSGGGGSFKAPISWENKTHKFTNLLSQDLNLRGNALRNARVLQQLKKDALSGSNLSPSYESMVCDLQQLQGPSNLIGSDLRSSLKVADMRIQNFVRLGPKPNENIKVARQRLLSFHETLRHRAHAK